MMSVEEKAMELTTRLDDGWRVETNIGPILFPADAGAVAVATARIEAEMLLKHRVILLQFSYRCFRVEIDRIKSGCLLYDSVARDWLFFPTSEGRNRYGDGLFFRRFCMDLHTLAGRRQAKAVIASMLP